MGQLRDQATPARVAGPSFACVPRNMILRAFRTSSIEALRVGDASHFARSSA
jgi:hypothetical protein